MYILTINEKEATNLKKAMRVYGRAEGRKGKGGMV